MKYRFRATRAFWRSFGRLSAQQQRRAKLSARYARVIYAAEIEGDLRVVFYIERDVVVTVDIGSHDLYR